MAALRPSDLERGTALKAIITLGSVVAIFTFLPVLLLVIYRAHKESKVHKGLLLLMLVCKIWRNFSDIVAGL